MNKENPSSADTGATEPAAKAPSPQARSERRLGIRLVPVDNSDQPVLANYTSVQPSTGIAFLDFGFLEPGMLAALPRVARQGGKLPESVDGKLAVRVAMGYDAVANLHQQLGQLLTKLGEASSAKPRKQG